ncbi:helix-turn-helix domain-containing protein [Paraburkholderia sp. USG1]|uniref:helix-turn-helix domain-containing protein n=1 Tax=Paraburkholderia sp. USG1 TaxID=2952268 RepID=UPI002861C860|nr:helix-turn-helix transcriptional regulator [Paraburkholderia sp. USG1]MDR8401698.1 helix-turn-helix domain-containing protein [Paraburkholderia sp. USG1]
MDLVARRLREARIRSGLSQERLGIEAGIDEMSASARMNQYERGKHVPDLGTLSRIAAVLNLPVTYFYSVEDHEAELVQRYHRMPEKAKKQVLELADELAGAS